ncbi:hypothetical protein K503DRAFT_717128 [Rhizopogon vinicolor AM-OR11-026]|uniref:Mmc1 C-terminal domain-containing protein n=1 Tax=Rhizopogon vinicolor AM-OR11-026 TaxID=1314800 RepID=A0A1B7N2Q3_9AGAM|nr:hypothetical protein K503DRAFT_717128 [Rhizopogon vinicolor AM-OR11-026]
MSSCLVARHHALRTFVLPRDLNLGSEVSVVHDAWCTGKASKLFVNGRRRCFRAYSSNGASKDSFTKDASSRRHKVSALLHRISSFLPRALSASTNDSGIQSSQLWHELLSDIDAALSSPSESDAYQSARVVVCGADQWAGSQELVTALLENPFTSDEDYSDILRNRWKNQSAYLTIDHGPSTSLVNGALAIPSSWLQQYPLPIRVTEIASLSSQATLQKTLLEGDALVLICNPLTTPLATLISKAGYILQRSKTILLLTASGASEHALGHVKKELAAAGCQPGKVLAVDPVRALDAISALKSNTSSPSAIRMYQNDFTGSRISIFSEVLGEMLGSKDSGHVSLLDIRTQTALMQMRSALCASARSVNQARATIDRVFTGTSELQSQVEEVCAKTDEVLTESGVDQALLRSSKEMKTLLDSLTWPKMIWRVDEIDTLVGSALEGYWCRELESQLILQTGRLASTQTSLTSSTFSLLAKLASPSSPSFPAFHSPILDNHLRQLAHSPSFALTPDTLIRPIQARRSQLAKHTTMRLHHDAQNAVLGAFGGIFGGAGLGWWLAFGESALSLGAGSEAGTALGAGALVAVASIRWAVGKWERAKRHWVDDANRVSEGLKRDLKVRIKTALHWTRLMCVR